MKGFKKRGLIIKEGLLLLLLFIFSCHRERNKLEPLDTTIDSYPPSPLNSSFVTFEFSCNRSSCDFECSLDGETFKPCSSPWSYSDLSEGEHDFFVRAIDSYGNFDESPASYSFRIEIPPQTTITSFPPNPSGSKSASFEFRCNEEGCSFECSLDKEGFSPCSSPKIYEGLAEGIHIFEVRAIDSFGLIDESPASYSWEIDTLLPETTLISFPESITNSTIAIFEFSCNRSVCDFECQLDLGGFDPCSSPLTYEDLGEGTHTFDVRAIDDIGRVDQTPASYIWTIDLTPPDTIITSKPTNPSTFNYAVFKFMCNEADCSFLCQLDSGGWEECASPKSYSGLVKGTHTFEVRAKDSAGNINPVSTTYSWEIKEEVEHPVKNNYFLIVEADGTSRVEKPPYYDLAVSYSGMNILRLNDQLEVNATVLDQTRTGIQFQLTNKGSARIDRGWLVISYVKDATLRSLPDAQNSYNQSIFVFGPLDVGQTTTFTIQFLPNSQDLQYKVVFELYSPKERVALNYSSNVSVPVATITPDGKELYLLPSEPNSWVQGLRWSSGMEWITFFATEYGKTCEEKPHHIYIVHPDGSQLRKVLSTDCFHYSYHPVFTPEAKHIMYRCQSRAGTYESICLNDLSGQQERVIVSGAGWYEDGIRLTDLSPDGTKIIATAQETQRQRYLILMQEFDPKTFSTLGPLKVVSKLFDGDTVSSSYHFYTLSGCYPQFSPDSRYLICELEHRTRQNLSTPFSQISPWKGYALLDLQAMIESGLPAYIGNFSTELVSTSDICSRHPGSNAVEGMAHFNSESTRIYFSLRYNDDWWDVFYFPFDLAQKKVSAEVPVLLNRNLKRYPTPPPPLLGGFYR